MTQCLSLRLRRRSVGDGGAILWRLRRRVARLRARRRARRCRNIRVRRRRRGRLGRRGRRRSCLSAGCRQTLSRCCGRRARRRLRRLRSCCGCCAGYCGLLRKCRRLDLEQHRLTSMRRGVLPRELRCQAHRTLRHQWRSRWSFRLTNRKASRGWRSSRRCADVGCTCTCCCHSRR